MSAVKRLEKFGKFCIRALLKRVLIPGRIPVEDIRVDSIMRILVVRQDSRLGNLVLMTPLLSALKAALPEAELDVVISEGFEEIIAGNPSVDRMFVFRKRKARFLPFWYVGFVRRLRNRAYDLAVDVSDGRHFSLNGALLTRLSNARYRLGYDREYADTFMNVLVPPPPPDTYMADAIRDILKAVLPGVREYPPVFYINEDERIFAGEWLQDRNISEYDSFFVIHPGGKGRKRWGARCFAGLIDRIGGVTGARIVVIGAEAEREEIGMMRKLSRFPFDVLENVTVGQMAAVIERCDLYISGDTGPMHVAAALGRPTVAVFTSSDYQVYGPRIKRSRVITGVDGVVSVEDVVNAVWDLLSIDPEADQ